jgi:hypothetical protein
VSVIPRSGPPTPPPPTSSTASAQTHRRWLPPTRQPSTGPTAVVVGFAMVLSIGASLGAVVAVFQWGWAHALVGAQPCWLTL